MKINLANVKTVIRKII